jgi:hypothetical protein
LHRFQYSFFKKPIDWFQTYAISLFFTLRNGCDSCIDLIKRGTGPVKKINNIRFKKTNGELDGEIKFDSNLLNLYLAIDETKTANMLIKETELDLTVFKQCLLKLIKLKLIKPIKVDETEYVNDMFLDRLREVLIELSGPMGEFLIEQTAEEMGFEVTKIPVSEAADFVYQISTVIPSEKQAIKFKKIMLQELLKRSFNK